MFKNPQYLDILKNLTILYIEDEETIKENIKKTLLLFSNKIFDVKDIKSAKETLENQKIDIIISDINLPDETGIELIKEIRKTDKTLPIIILSAYTEKHYLLEATKLKLVDYLTKPMDFKTLQNALFKCVDEILENSRFIVSFKNRIIYNVLQKKLIDENKDEEISLTAKEILLLDFLIKNNNRVVPIEELKSVIWDDEFEATESAFKNLLNKIRKKIGKESILNISGVGYKLDY